MFLVNIAPKEFTPCEISHICRCIFKNVWEVGVIYDKQGIFYPVWEIFSQKNSEFGI